MTEHADFLVEIGTEELPPKALPRLADAFVRGVVTGIEKAGLTHGAVQPFATPRRLALRVRDLALAQPARAFERRGPALSAAFGPDGRPGKAAEGFARSCGVSLDTLDRVETDKGAWLVHRGVEPGQATAKLLPGFVEEALARLPIPKRMRWADLSVEFVRPVHWVVMLLGAEVIDTTILGTPSGRQTRGHRFHHPAPLVLGSPSEYDRRLASEGRVLADFAQRRERIRAQVDAVAAQLGARALIDAALLDEVTALVEWPVALAGGFESRFLAVPSEALVATMTGNQKYFPVVDEQGALQPFFIAVANIESRDPAAIRTGNERVVRPRLADAEFFWEQDRKTSLESRRERLAGVVFQQQLGTLLDKSERLVRVTRGICRLLAVESERAVRAAELSKCDLLTDMVGEFPELQGVMGRYYATHDGEHAEVALALDEQYLPRFAGDRLPTSTAGQVLALADKLDTLAGSFGIGQVPSGDKDPFGLRRAAVGVLRILIEQQLEPDLHELLALAARAFDLFEPEPVADQLFEYTLERLRAHYQDAGIGADVFEAVHSRRPTRPLDFDRRIRAVAEFRNLPEAASLTAANKRIQNILRQMTGELPREVDPALLTEPAEQSLAAGIAELHRTVEPLLEQGQYTPALAALAGLEGAVNRFFDEVLVMAEDSALRDNRLALLKDLGDLFLRTADVSKLQF